MPWRRSDYPADWEAIVSRIRERAEGRCECVGECGKPACLRGRCEARNGQPHPVTGGKVTLTTAHLDHDPASRDESRLRHFCNRCHLVYDRAHHARNAAATLRARQTAALEQAGQGELFKSPR